MDTNKKEIIVVKEPRRNRIALTVALYASLFLLFLSTTFSIVTTKQLHDLQKVELSSMKSTLPISESDK